MDNIIPNKVENDSIPAVSNPSNLRISASKRERLRRLSVIFIYALFVGLGVYHIQSFAHANGALLGDSGAMFYRAVAFIFAIAAVSLNALYIYYAAKVQGKLTWMRMGRHCVNAFFPLLAVILLASGAVGANISTSIPDSISSVNSGTNVFIYIVAAGSIVSAVWTLIENLLQRKTFPSASKIAIYLLPGVIIAIVGMIILTTKTSADTAKISDIVMPIIITAAGVVTVLFAAALLKRSSDYGNKLKKLIKYGFVSHLMITFTILTCFLFSMTNFSLLSKDTLGIVVFIIQLIATAGMIAFIIYTSRSKGIKESNPIHNRIWLMFYVGFVNILGLLVIFQSPTSISAVSDKSEFAFTFLGLSALQTLIVVIVAGVMAYVTIEFKGITALWMGAIQIALVLFLTTVIFIEKDNAIITKLMGRFVILLVYASILMVYLAFELYWVFFLVRGEKSNRTKNKKAKLIKDKKEGQNE